MLREIKNELYHYFEDGRGRRQGQMKFYSSSGDVREISHYVDGYLTGEFIQFYMTGTVRLLCHYVGSNLNGPFLAWHDNGGIDSITTACSGIVHGEYKSYTRDGMLSEHRYMLGGTCLHDFILNPLDDAGRMLLVLKYGGQFLPEIDLSSIELYNSIITKND